MAFAEYFQRNAQAAAALIQGFDATLLSVRLENEVIGIAYDGSVERSKEGQAGVDLALRLVCRLYPTIAIVGLPGTRSAYLGRLRALARSINPQIDILDDVAAVTRLLVFGQSRITGNAKSKRSTWYVGSNNWIATLSKTQPTGSGRSANPLAAGAAACVAAANVFRAVFVRELGQAALDTDVAFSLIDLRPTTGHSANPVLGLVQLHDVHLVGAGAIGNGVLWALGRMPCEGTLHVVDHETVTDSNLQRYVMLKAADRGSKKVDLAASWLNTPNSKLTAVPQAKPWAEHVASIADAKVDTVLSAVDTARARIQIQASLPRVIYNGWTQRGEAGVSRHWFLGEMACLACLYLPTGQTPNEDVLVSRALRLPQDESTIREVRRRLQQAVPTERGYLEQLATAAGIPVDKLLPFEGRSLRDLYTEGVCGGQVMEFHQAAIQAKAEVPMGFQSAFAGILLAAELARPSPLADTIAQIDMLGTFPERPGHARANTTVPQCLCLDQDFRHVFQKKYAPR
jgi:hypothetical protein